MSSALSSQTLPAPAAGVDAAAKIQRTVLSNGLRIITEAMPQVRSVSLGIWVTSGSRREEAAENGITHFIEHMVFKGTTHRSAEDIARSVDSVGGNLDAFTSKESVCFNAKVLDEHVPVALEVLADLVRNPLFREEDISREQSVIVQEIKMDEDNPDYLVHEIFTQNFWKDHPLGRPILGTKDTIRALKQDALRRYYGECFAPGNLVVAAAGNLDHQRFVDWVAGWFDDLRPVANGHVESPPKNHARIILRNKKQLEQVQVFLGLPADPIGHDRRYVWSVLNTLLGGGMSSRLFQNIRERQGLAYAVFSDLNPYRDVGMFCVYAGTGIQTVPQVVRSVIAELRDLKNQFVPPEELRRAKDGLKGSLMLGLESTGSRMSNLARQEIYFERRTSLDEMLQRIEMVTAEDLRAVANECFVSEKIGVTVLGNLNGLKITRSDLEI